MTQGRLFALITTTIVSVLVIHVVGTAIVARFIFVVRDALHDVAGGSLTCSLAFRQ